MLYYIDYIYYFILRNPIFLFWDHTHWWYAHALYSGITSAGLQRPYGVPKIEFRSVLCKESALLYQIFNQEILNFYLIL